MLPPFLVCSFVVWLNISYYHDNVYRHMYIYNVYYTCITAWNVFILKTINYMKIWLFLKLTKPNLPFFSKTQALLVTKKQHKYGASTAVGLYVRFYPCKLNSQFEKKLFQKFKRKLQLNCSSDLEYYLYKLDLYPRNKISVYLYSNTDAQHNFCKNEKWRSFSAVFVNEVLPTL